MKNLRKLIFISTFLFPFAASAQEMSRSYWSTAGGWEIYKIVGPTGPGLMCLAEQNQGEGLDFFLQFIPADPLWLIMFKNDRWPMTNQAETEIFIAFGDNPGNWVSATPIEGVFYNVMMDLGGAVPYLEEYQFIHISNQVERVSYRTAGLNAAIIEIRRCAASMGY